VTARHIYVDETKHRDYLMVAAVVLGEDLTSARAVVQELLKPGQRHLHMKDEADGRKETIAKALVSADLRATVYDAGQATPHPGACAGRVPVCACRGPGHQ
jgi:hypothetical protein